MKVVSYSKKLMKAHGLNLSKIPTNERESNLFRENMFKKASNSKMKKKVLNVALEKAFEVLRIKAGEKLLAKIESFK